MYLKTKSVVSHDPFNFSCFLRLLLASLFQQNSLDSDIWTVSSSNIAGYSSVADPLLLAYITLSHLHTKMEGTTALNNDGATTNSTSGMHAFEIEDPREAFLTSAMPQHLQSNSEVGMIGGLLTKYSLFGGTNDNNGNGNAGGYYDSVPFSHDDGSDYHGEHRRYHNGDDSLFQQVLQSPLVRKAMIALIFLAVILHLSMDNSGKTGGGYSMNQQTEADPPLHKKEHETNQPNNSINNSNQQQQQQHEPSTPSLPAPVLPVPNKNSNTNDNEMIVELQPIFEPLEPPPNAHSFTFGGDNNKGHTSAPVNDSNDSKEKDTEEKQTEAEIEHDTQVYSHSHWDISSQNDQNLPGHYLHDPFRSPFASHLYQDITSAEIHKRQVEFEQAMEDIRQRFGAWDNDATPPKLSQSRSNLFDSYGFRDVFFDDETLFDPQKAWQLDKDYILEFINQAKVLVKATIEGIMTEYGHPNAKYAERWPFDVIIEDYEVLDGIAVDHQSAARLPGIAYMPQRSWDILQRKLLHAMITEDHYYVVAVGGQETYAANNFAQSQVMQFNYIMEPIFHKLGINLISRNMGMDASTTVTALGGGDILGEADILWHIEDADKEEAHGAFDLLHRQAIMSGERVPIIMSANTDEVTISSKAKALVGNLQPGADMCSVMDKSGLPSACQALDECSENCYNSVCWENRSDFTPPMKQNQDVGGKHAGFPGYRHHQLEGRKMALLHLHALNSALNQWSTKITGVTLPLHSALWHVGDMYSDIRKEVMTLTDRKPGEAIAFSASCELLMKELDPRICHLPMHALTEWTPRVTPKTKRLSSIINNVLEGEVESDDQSDWYTTFPDIVPLSWQVPKGELDVHMIAIATYDPSTDDDGVLDVLGDDDWSYHGHNNGHRRRQMKDDFVDDIAPHFVGTSNRNLEQNTPDSSHHRRLTITEGTGWRLQGVPIGFCDGSAQSTCNRSKDNKCLLANHNHYKGSIVGSSENGWLTMKIHGVRHGIILLRLEWLEFDLDLDGTAPDDLLFEFDVNGRETELYGTEFRNHAVTIVPGLTVIPILLGEEVVGLDTPDTTYEIGIRIQSKKDPQFKIWLTHVYFS